MKSIAIATALFLSAMAVQVQAADEAVLSPAAMEQLALAEKLIALGRTNNDPLLLIAAAQIRNTVSDEPVGLPGERTPQAALIDEADPLVPAACRLSFSAEASSIRWFYRTQRTHSNFYRSCAVRDRFFPRSSAEDTRSSQDDPSAPLEGSTVRRALDVRGHTDEAATRLLAQWRRVLWDELENTRAALPLAEADVRLDCQYGRDHSFSHVTDMIRAKLELLEAEIDVLLPDIASKIA